MFTKLYTDVGADLAYFINKYVQDYMTELNTEFTYVTYQRLVSNMFNLIYPGCPGYTNIHTVVSKALEMLWKSVIANKSQLQLISQLEDTIFNLLHPKPSIFKQTASLSVAATIRPEIQLYINKYGFPSGGIFDTIKLGEILNELNP